MAKQPMDVEYNQDLARLETLLSKVKRSGDFVVAGTVEIPMPNVEIEGIGPLSFPVPEAQVQALIARATRAPYGRGPETVVDESVRKVWQLPADEVRIGGRSWPAHLAGVLSQVTTGLGCTGMRVSAELYKLLVYDTGGFFLSHRDTEKAEGMFGTLVVVFPAPHRGGELIVRHGDRTVTLDMSRAEGSEVSFAAFYADCEHEVRPITHGNRVCLVYNLILERRTKTGGRPVQAPDYEKEITAAAALLEEHLAAPDAPAKLVWLLEHQYTPDGLSFAALKLADAARVKVLAQAADRAGCTVHLGIVHLEEWGAAEPRFYNRRPRRWGRYYEEEEEEEEAVESDQDDFEVVEVSDQRQYISQWRDAQDQSVEFGDIPIEAGELLPAGALDDEPPDQQRLTEASGNEGASFERSYHRAAFVLWRRDRYAEVLLQAGVVAALPYLAELIRTFEAGSKESTAKAPALDLARRMVESWNRLPSHYSFHYRTEQPEGRDRMLRLLDRLGDAALLGDFISDTVTPKYDGSENTALAACARRLEPGVAAGLYAGLFRGHMRLRPGPCVELLHTLTGKGKVPSHRSWRDALIEIAGAAVSGLAEAGRKQEDDPWMPRLSNSEKPPVEPALVVKLFDALGRLEAAALRADAVNLFAAGPDVFDAVTILVPALGRIRDRDDTVTRLWQHCVDFLIARSGHPPAAPTDWRQNVRLSCSCADCRELQAFVLDPLAQVHRFRIRQDRRQHLHGIIDRHGLDMTHVTERKGSPQTLVCTKDRRSYLRRCEQYRQDIDALAKVESLADRCHASPAAVNQIQSARQSAQTWATRACRGDRVLI